MVVNWKKLEKTVEDLKAKDLDKEEERWYRALEGSSPYEKVKSLISLCDKSIKVYERSKRLRDEEL